MEIAKKAACKAAIKDIGNSKYIGIGSGSTIVYLFNLMRDTFSKEELREKIFVPTSFQSQTLIHEFDLIQGTLNQYPKLDIVIDGADEVTKEMVAIKGGGGCHYLEKLVYHNATKRIIVVDESKLSLFLGEKWKYVPVEVDTIALSPVRQQLIRMHYDPQLRMSRDKAGPVITDQGNCILDLQLNCRIDARKMYNDIKLIPGVIEIGLFWDYNTLYIGKTNGECDHIQ